MKAIEPALAGTYYGGYFTESDSTGDIHKFTSGIASAIERMGVACRYEQNVIALRSDGRQASVTVQVGAEQSVHHYDGLVVCAGVESRSFASQLGDRVNIYLVKGYSITVNLQDAHSQAAAPTVSLLDDETKLVTSRLGLDRFRVAGTAEFNGYNKDIRADRIRPLVPWAGLRPMMPNMMPRIGTGRLVNVFYNTGHGHLGWTLSAVTCNR